MTLARWILAFVLSTGVALAQSGPKWEQDSPLLNCEGIPCVDAQINGQEVRLGLDTGNDASVFDSGAAARMHLPAPDHSSSPQQIQIDSVSLGKVNLENVSAIVMDLSGAIAQHQFPAVDGTIAYTAFAGRIVQLDFVHHRFKIARAGENTECSANNCDVFSLIDFNPEGPPVIVANGFAVNGHPITSQIDTMFTGSLLIYSTAVTKTGLMEAAKKNKEREFAFTDGGVKMKEASADSESFHQLRLPGEMVYFPTAEVHEPGDRFDATVGLELLRNAILTLDFKNKRIWVQAS